MPASIKAKLTLVTGQGSGGTGGGVTPDVADSLRDMARFFRRPQNIFGGGGGMGGLGIGGGGGAALAAGSVAAAAIGAIIGDKVADKVLPKMNEFYYKHFFPEGATSQSELNDWVSKNGPLTDRVPQAPSFGGGQTLNDVAQIQKEITEITKDEVISEDELIKLKALRVGLEEKRKQLVNEIADANEKGLLVSEQDVQARSEVLNTLMLINDVILNGVGSIQLQTQAQRDYNAELQRTISLAQAKQKYEGNDSDLKRLIGQAERTGKSDGFTATIKGQEGTYQGRIFNTAALGGPTPILVKVK